MTDKDSSARFSASKAMHTGRAGPLSEVKMVCPRVIIAAAALWLLLVLVPVSVGAEAADPPVETDGVMDRPGEQLSGGERQSDSARTGEEGRSTAGTPLEDVAEAAQSSPVWFAADRTGVLVGCLLCGFAIFAGIGLVRHRKEITLRRIAGLAAIDEAVGRATEMGRPVLYSPGISPMSRVSTMASMNILGTVAERVAAHGTRLLVPCADAVVMTVAQEVVRESCLRVGHPDAYEERDIFFLTESQFGYAAAVDGLMLRERPATNLYMGSFAAESLILAETGHVTGAIQVAGTDSTIQLAFFLVTCDYTLIGEELYAASAYLSREPSLLGCLVGQDWLKIAAILLAVLGAILSTFGIDLVARALVQ